MKGCKEVLKTNREKPPCYGCTEKFTACYDRCPKDERGEYGYKAWRAAVKETEDRRKAYYKELYEYRRKKWRKKSG